jgi:hypothetical protein
LLREDCQPMITNDIAPLFTAAVCCVYEWFFFFFYLFIYIIANNLCSSVCDALRTCVHGLREETKDVLFPLLFFLNLLSQYSNTTKMTVKNSSLIFTPLFFTAFQDKSNLLAMVCYYIRIEVLRYTNLFFYFLFLFFFFLGIVNV